MIGSKPGGHEDSMTLADTTFEALEPAHARSSGVLRAGQSVGDAKLRQLIDLHFDFIWRSLRRLGLSSADADDGAQQVFWVAARKLDRIEAGRERAFLFGTAVRVASDARRAASRRPEGVADALDLSDPAPGPEELAEQVRARALLDEVLDTMPLEARTAFVLFELEELSVVEIAELVGVPVGTVASRLRRARELFHTAAKRMRAKAQSRGGLP
jgi:RNA polymerase sigma-70 factor (ECF subfamily)